MNVTLMSEKKHLELIFESTPGEYVYRNDEYNISYVYLMNALMEVLIRSVLN